MSERVSGAALSARIESGMPPAILDVRSAAEFNHGHVPGAVHIPFWRLSRGVAGIPFSRDAEVVIYCGHGPRALVAGALLRRRGFSRIKYLDGHYSKWRSAGFREERSV